ncbi:MAG: periplasmic heavy metal sensor [Bacteroidales bacterium]|jgi:Spy/CpxP family protein refolding chaperone|nr:periplasmic heavy metal sensor [Bacteroidales bacterium]
MKTKVLFLSVLFLSSIFVGHLSAQQRDYQNRKECLIDDLTAEQKTSIDAIKFKSEAKVKNYRADLDIKKAELRKLQVADVPSEKLIHQKIDEISALNTNIRKENASKRIAVRNELTPEQQNVYDSYKLRRGGNKNYHQMKSNRNSNCEYRGMDRSHRPMNRNR